MTSSRSSSQSLLMAVDIEDEQSLHKVYVGLVNGIEKVHAVGDIDKALFWVPFSFWAWSFGA